MKIVTTYIAYDDTEFYTMEECQEYEQCAWNMLAAIIDNVTVYYNIYEAPLEPPYFHTLDEALAWFEDTFSICKYMRVKEDIPVEAYKWQDRIFGYEFPIKKGMYKYDWNIDKWV